MEDAAHRSGRPGLSSVKGDARGLTISQPGDAGTERPGTTLRPAWIKVHGLEIEREVVAYVTQGEQGYELHEVRNGTFDYWLKHLRDGEQIIIFHEETGALIATARIQQGALQMNRELPELVVSSAAMLRLVRVRAVAMCALELIEKHGKLTNEEAGNALSRHRTLIARETKRALRKAIETAEGMGMSREELMCGLQSMGVDR